MPLHTFEIPGTGGQKFLRMLIYVDDLLWQDHAQDDGAAYMQVIAYLNSHFHGKVKHEDMSSWLTWDVDMGKTGVHISYKTYTLSLLRSASVSRPTVGFVHPSLLTTSPS